MRIEPQDGAAVDVVDPVETLLAVAGRQEATNPLVVRLAGRYRPI